MAVDFILPDWPAPTSVRALQTTRHGGLSQAPWASLNLGDHVGDEVLHVAANRQHLRSHLPAEPIWLQQVHGNAVLSLPLSSDSRSADATCTRELAQVCVVLSADCLPILLCDSKGSVVAAVHAGWRGLCSGVIESAVVAMGVPGETLMAWLGPAIGPSAFEVGAEVRQAFIEQDVTAVPAFVPGLEDRWFADLYTLARQRLMRLGVNAVYGGDRCTYTEADDFFSYRRDRQTGRMASLIWIE